MNVQEMIKALLDVGFSEEAIAFGAKVHKSSISRIFTGKTKSPRYHVVNNIEKEPKTLEPVSESLPIQSLDEAEKPIKKGVRIKRVKITNLVE